MFVPDAATAQDIPFSSTEGEEITIDAEQISYDQKADTLVADGNVVITRGEMQLLADHVRLNRRTNEADARGNVHLTTPEGTVVADVIDLSLDEETGFLEKAEITSRRSQFSLRGDRVEKGIGQSYRIENGTFTTCHCAEGAPSWSVSGKDLQVTLAGYGTLTGGTFNVLDHPIIYLPRAVFPIQRDRQTGFLLPRFGVSNTRGFQAFQPFYWSINKSQDATVALDLETSARVGLVGEYRYALSRTTQGLLNAAYFNESFRGATPTKPFEQTIPENRWSVTSEHTQGLTDSTYAYADAFLVSDDLYLREMNTYATDHVHDVGIRSLPFTASRAGILQTWDRLAWRAEGVYYQNLTSTESHTLQRAPELDAWAQTLVGSHLLGSLDASLVDFQRSRDVDGVRLDVQPNAMVPLPLGPHVFGSVQASIRETAYHLFEDTVSSSGVTLPEDRSRELFQLGAEVGSSLDRVYSVDWLGMEKLKHTIEPRLAYLYVPPISQGDLPLFDGVDRVNHRNLITYGVVSRFLGKFAQPPATKDSPADQSPTQSGGGIRELGRLALTQSVDLSREIGAPSSAGSDHFSDLDFDGRVNPSRAFSLYFHTGYDTGLNDISVANVGFLVRDPRTLTTSSTEQDRLAPRTSAAVSYRFLTQNQLQEVDDTLALRLTRWAGLLYSSRYDVVANRFLDNHVGLHLSSTCDCWALEVGVTDRTNPHEVQVSAQLTLAGLGSSSPKP